jgi:hypothetical protein
VVSATYPFSQEEFERACREWGCNCGPSALAFALRRPLEVARDAIPGFAAKRYTSPTMMRQALEALGVAWRSAGLLEPAAMCCASAMSLVRIQWTGPWTAPGMNPRWAYGYTHWVAAWCPAGTSLELVFDCNGGVCERGSWEREIVPLITREVKRADGGWRPTHIWRLG